MSAVQILQSPTEAAKRRVELAASQWLIGRPELMARVLDPRLSDADAEAIVARAAAQAKGLA